MIGVEKTLEHWFVGLSMDSLVALTALVISIIALVYTVKAYLLKSGLNIRGVYTMAESLSCSEPYIDNVLLENIKDRAVVVLKVFLRLGHNFYLELEDYESEPLILKPFEAVRIKPGPVDRYVVNMQRTSLKAIFRNPKVTKTLILKTTDGRYVVRTRTKFWDPIAVYFRNYGTELVTPMRATHKGISYGDRVKYLLEINAGREDSSVIPLHGDDHTRRIFKQFPLTADSLKNEAALAEFLNARRAEEKWSCETFVIHDLDSWRERSQFPVREDASGAAPTGWFRYFVLGRIGTVIANRRMKAENERRSQEATEKLKAIKQVPSESEPREEKPDQVI